MRTWIKLWGRFGIVLPFLLLAAGCMTPPRPLPASYFAPKRQMMVVAKNCPQSPQLMNTDQGGGLMALVGAAVNAARQAEMNKQMQGIGGDTVKALLKQQLSSKLEDTFELTDETDQLESQIFVSQWGWFVPTTMLAIKTGSYQFQLTGGVSVFELKPKRKGMATYRVSVSEPLGNTPTPQLCQEALLRLSEKFANGVTAIMLSEKGKAVAPAAGPAAPSAPAAAPSAPTVAPAAPSAPADPAVRGIK